MRFTASIAIGPFLNSANSKNLRRACVSDHKGARLIVEALPSGSTLIADRGYDSNWLREALADKDITSCIPPTKSRKVPIAYNKALYRQRHKVEMV